MIHGIVCVGENWEIGKNNGLCFRLPEDMKFFRDQTYDAIVVCGYNTLMSFPGGKPLPARSTFVLDAENRKRDDCFVFGDFGSLLACVKELAKTQAVWIIGGGMLYKSFLPYYDSIWVTKVLETDKEASVFFPNIDEDDRFYVSYQDPIRESTTGLKYKIMHYKKKAGEQE